MNRLNNKSEPDPIIVEGEVVGPDFVDRLYEYVEQRRRDGQLSRSQMRMALQNLVDRDPSFDTGRALFAALGGALGSSYRALGAAGGAGVGALLYDLLQGARRRHL